MTDKSIIASGLEPYGKNSALRALVQTILPGVGAYIDNTLISKRDELQRKRAGEFIEELDRQAYLVTACRLSRDLDDGEDYTVRMR